MRRYEAVFQMLPAKLGEAVNVFVLSTQETDNLLTAHAGEELKVKGNRLLVYCDAPDKDAARKRTAEIAGRFSRLVSMKTAQYFSPIFQGLDSIPPERGHSILAPLPNAFWVDSYDRGQFPADLAAAGVICSIEDKTLHRATEYFLRGLFYRRVVWSLIHPLAPEGAFNMAEATLNFYKAVAVIIGDEPSGGRAQAMGVDKNTRTRIEKLYQRRSKRDVAHPLMDSAALDELRDSLWVSQKLAREVIEKYAAFLQSGEVLPPVPSSGGRQRRRKP